MVVMDTKYYDETFKTVNPELLRNSPVSFCFKFFFVACSIDGILGMYSVLLLPLTTVVIDGDFI